MIENLYKFSFLSQIYSKNIFVISKLNTLYLGNWILVDPCS